MRVAAGLFLRYIYSGSLHNTAVLIITVPAIRDPDKSPSLNDP
jgi:hypothetical protein